MNGFLLALRFEMTLVGWNHRDAVDRSPLRTSLLTLDFFVPR